MSGHSKWSTIKHKKAATDAKRGKLFTQLAREIAIAARKGGGNPEFNFTLRLAMDRAKAANMPKDNIERAIKRGSGELKGAELEEISYEAYAPHGVALLVQVLTDNRNRAAADVRSTFTKNGGSLGEPGSVGYLFEQKGYLLAVGDEDTVMMAALEGGADDVEASGDLWELTCAAGDLPVVRAALEDAGVTIDQGEVTQSAAVLGPVDADHAPRLLRLVDTLEDLDDVQAVYANFDIPDEVLAAME